MQQQRQYVGIDLHRRRSVIVRVDEYGEHPASLRRQLLHPPAGKDVINEAVTTAP